MTLDSTLMFIEGYLGDHSAAVSQLSASSVASFIRELQAVRERGALLFLAGNGGSAATASHLGIDFTKGVAQDGAQPLRAISLADSVPVMSAIGNDLSFADVFTEPLRHLAADTDALLVISASGRSPNIVKALEFAARRKMKTLALLGMGGGDAAALADVSIIVPSDDYGVIEDMHMLIGHLATAFLRGRAGPRSEQ